VTSQFPIMSAAAAGAASAITATAARRRRFVMAIVELPVGFFFTDRNMSQFPVSLQAMSQKT
jgi:hypothetical protein